MTIRIKDIAEKAGVSTGTVDRVIHKRGNVKKDVRERVELVMSELGYKRNFIASTLAYNRTLRISALIFNSDPYWTQIKEGIEKAQDATSHYGVRISLHYADQRDPKVFGNLAKAILTSRPDAILFAPLFLGEGLKLLRACRRKSIPAVLINTDLDDPGALCYIGQNSYQSGQLAAKLLHFGIHGEATALLLNLDADSQNAKHLKDKEQGFRDYFVEKHSKDIQVVSRNFADYDDKGKLKKFLSETFALYPDLAGIFVTNSRTYKLIECLEELEHEDIKLVGFDLISENLTYLRKNRINFLINQNPVLQGYLGIMNIVNHLLLKQEISPLQYLPLDIVVIENCDYYEQSSYTLPIVM